jgi:glutamate-1-semialdehyde 2,1-aminomutase
MGSVRFPGKVLQTICGTPLIGLLLERLSGSRQVDAIVLATSEDPRNEPLVRYTRELGYEVFQGSETDVLDRYYRAAQTARADTVVRITGDCPLIDPQLVDAVVERFRAGGADYFGNVSPATYPDGLDTEVFSFRALEIAWRQASTPFQREHVTPFLRESEQFRRGNLANDNDVSAERWTVDEPADLNPVRRVFEYFHPRRDFGWLEVLKLRQSHPEWFMSNRHLRRNEGQDQGSGQKLWKRARQVIPGGSMLLSKRAEMFLP